MTTNPDPIANLRTLLEKATPGPWMNNQHYECAHTHSSKVAVRPVFHYSHNNPNAEQDAALIVAAVNALPKLLEVYEAAETASRECDCVSGDEHMQALTAALAALREGTP